jgi:hypothetical protein
MQNILILTVLLINILMKVAVQCERERNKYKNWSRMDHKSNYFGPTLLIIEKILGKMKT